MQDVFMPVTSHQWDKSKRRPSVEAACPGKAPRAVKIRWLHGVYPGDTSFPHAALRFSKDSECHYASPLSKRPGGAAPPCMSSGQNQDSGWWNAKEGQL